MQEGESAVVEGKVYVCATDAIYTDKSKLITVLVSYSIGTKCEKPAFLGGSHDDIPSSTCRGFPSPAFSLAKVASNEQN
jgi:hypothetical protein